MQSAGTASAFRATRARLMKPCSPGGQVFECSADKPAGRLQDVTGARDASVWGHEPGADGTDARQPRPTDELAQPSRLFWFNMVVDEQD